MYESNHGISSLSSPNPRFGNCGACEWMSINPGIISACP
ncbi:hypothetical protein B0I68_001302 [Clostridium beijerinckii]|nr:hypothetical protein [Clostridium beijerinckii]